MNELNGTRDLVATNLRRDKLLLPICAVTFAGVAGSSAASTAGLYPDSASRSLGAELLKLRRPWSRCSAGSTSRPWGPSG
jgi:putative exporter of polyketide antibiotics